MKKPIKNVSSPSRYTRQTTVRSKNTSIIILAVLLIGAIGFGVVAANGGLENLFQVTSSNGGV